MCQFLGVRYREGSWYERGGCVGFLLTHLLFDALGRAESFVCYICELLESEGFGDDCMIYKPQVSVNKQ